MTCKDSATISNGITLTGASSLDGETFIYFQDKNGENTYSRIKAPQIGYSGSRGGGIQVDDLLVNEFLTVNKDVNINNGSLIFKNKLSNGTLAIYKIFSKLFDDSDANYLQFSASSSGGDVPGYPITKFKGHIDTQVIP